MNEQWREILYPLGFLSTVAFGGRFLLQWIASERQKESVVPVSFWYLSLAGNFSLLVHSFIQMQYPICLVQACNGVISWRNLNLMQSPERQFQRLTVIGFLLLAIAFTTLGFFIQGMLIPDANNWLRVPTSFWNKTQSISFFWHLLGIAGIFLFNCRFWVQWWFAEKQKASILGRSFWWISLVGDLFCLLYFFRIGDLVNLIGPTFGLIPYIRNLMLLRKSYATTQ